jgi:hypothetical protein
MNVRLRGSRVFLIHRPERDGLLIEFETEKGPLVFHSIGIRKIGEVYSVGSFPDFFGIEGDREGFVIIRDMKEILPERR